MLKITKLKEFKLSYYVIIAMVFALFAMLQLQ